MTYWSEFKTSLNIYPGPQLFYQLSGSIINLFLNINISPMNSGLYELIKRESFHHIENSLLICPANEYSAYHTVAFVLGLL